MSDRKILMERLDIVETRHYFLRQTEEIRKCKNRRPDVYLDETWINQRDSVGRCWTEEDGTVRSKIKTGKGARFIILHSGHKDGYIPCALSFFS